MKKIIQYCNIILLSFIFNAWISAGTIIIWNDTKKDIITITLQLEHKKKKALYIQKDRWKTAQASVNTPVTLTIAEYPTFKYSFSTPENFSKNSVLNITIVLNENGNPMVEKNEREIL